MQRRERDHDHAWVDDDWSSRTEEALEPYDLSAVLTALNGIWAWHCVTHSAEALGKSRGCLLFGNYEGVRCVRVWQSQVAFAVLSQKLSVRFRLQNNVMGLTSAWRWLSRSSYAGLRSGSRKIIREDVQKDERFLKVENQLLLPFDNSSGRLAVGSACPKTPNSRSSHACVFEVLLRELHFKHISPIPARPQ